MYSAPVPFTLGRDALPMYVVKSVRSLDLHRFSAEKSWQFCQSHRIHRIHVGYIYIYLHSLDFLSINKYSVPCKCTIRTTHMVVWEWCFVFAMNLRGGWLDHVYNQHSTWLSTPPPKKKTGATVNGCKIHHVFGTKHHLKHQYESHSGSVNGGPNYYCLPCIAIAYWRRLPYESLRSRNPWGFINSSPGREVFGRL